MMMCASPAAATNWFVNWQGTGQFPTIQAALASALVVNGDIITLGDGVYSGPGNRDVSFLGKNVTIRSSAGNDFNEDVVIDCQGGAGNPHRAFLFNSGETSGATLLGLVIEHGYVENADGGGIWVGAASPTIDYCSVHGCVAVNGNGGGIACVGAGSPTISRCDVYSDDASGSSGANGGGIYTTGSATPTLQYLSMTGHHATYTGSGDGGHGGAIFCSNAQLLSVDASGNVASGRGGAIAASGSSATSLYLAGNSSGGPGGGASCVGSTMIGSVVVGNVSGAGGGGISASRTSVLQSCTISGNRAASGGGFSGADTDLESTIVWGNCASDASHEMDSGNNVTIGCCCVDPTGMVGAVGVSGAFVQSAPHFCNPISCSTAPFLGGDYSLNSQSPCLPAYNSCSSLIGAAGQGCATDAVEASVLGVHDELRAPAVSHGPIEIEYSLARAGRARLSLHDVGGRLIAVLADASMEPGRHVLRWSGNDDRGGHVAPGVYFMRLVTSSSVISRKVARLGS